MGITIKLITGNWDSVSKRQFYINCLMLIFYISSHIKKNIIFVYLANTGGKYCTSKFEYYFFQLRNLSYEELESRLSDLDPEMEREIDELRARYQAKRQPILDAIDAKKKRQNNF